VRELEMAEDGAYGRGVGEEGEDAHRRAALGAAEGEDLVDVCEELGPAGTSGGTGETVGGVLVGGGCFNAAGFGGFDTHLASQGDDVGPEPGVGGQDAVVAVAVDPGWWDEPGDVASSDVVSGSRSMRRRSRANGGRAQ